VLLDLDGFKAINDAYGHQVGDRVLTEVAAAMQATARSGELLARIGGDEFALLLPETASLEAFTVAERVRSLIERLELEVNAPLTASLGVCDLGEASSTDELVQLADGALYWAKGHGRNATWRYSPEVVEELSAAERAERLSRSQALTGVRALARAIDAKDASTRLHSERVAGVAAQLAEELGWRTEDVALLREAALVHDVGKIGVPDRILMKPGPLALWEYEQVKQHSLLGAQIASEVLGPQQVSWIRSHHERPDGRGYPDALEGDAIPEGGAILGLADAWDVMTSMRPYSAPMLPEAALAECERCRGTQFVPSVVNALAQVVATGGREVGPRP
jgi:diguanylate cyclase (GGDEF)-like protein/putative nucleotidyltransferase with HDIG domain